MWRVRFIFCPFRSCDRKTAEPTRIFRVAVVSLGAVLADSVGGDLPLLAARSSRAGFSSVRSARRR